MKKNFRFFDNRQKYLLFVTTTNEKNKIADENKIIQPLQDKELEKFDHYTSSEIEVTFLTHGTRKTENGRKDRQT